MVLGSPGNMKNLKAYLSEGLSAQEHGLLAGEHIPQLPAAQKNKVVVIFHSKGCDLRLSGDDVRRKIARVVLGP